MLISGTVIGCVTRVLNSSICFDSAISVMEAEVFLVVTREKSLACTRYMRQIYGNMFTLCIPHGINNLSFIVAAFCYVLLYKKIALL